MKKRVTLTETPVEEKTLVATTTEVTTTKTLVKEEKAPVEKTPTRTETPGFEIAVALTASAVAWALRRNI